MPSKRVVLARESSGFNFVGSFIGWRPPMLPQANSFSLRLLTRLARTFARTCRLAAVAAFRRTISAILNPRGTVNFVNFPSGEFLQAAAPREPVSL